MSMAAAISGDDAKVFHWSEDPRAMTCMTLDGDASAGPDERRRAKFLRRRRASSVPWRGTSMEGVYGASHRWTSIAGIAGACASSHPKIASSLGNCCSVGVTTAAGRVAGGVFIFAPSLNVARRRFKLTSQVLRDGASGTGRAGRRRSHVYAFSGVPWPLVGAWHGLSRWPGRLGAWGCNF